MAATYTLNAAAVTWAATKNIWAITNGTGSGMTVKVYRLWVANSQTGTVSGNYANVTLGRFTGSTLASGTALSFLKHDSTSAAVPAQIIAMSGATTTLTITGTFRTLIIPNDEVAINAAVTADELWTYVPLIQVWDAGYGFSTVEPITLAENEGATYVGGCDVWAEVVVV
jgi:hypothetical protein